MRSLLTRLRRRADEVAAGSAVPAGTAEPAGETASQPSARERGAMRRRVRQLRRRREAMLLELGALVFEMHRRDRHDAELVGRKASEIVRVDEEERGLAGALGAHTTVVEVVSAGIAGTCPNCGDIVATDARFCSRCGTELAAGIGAGATNGSHRAAPAKKTEPPESETAEVEAVKATDEPGDGADTGDGKEPA